MISEFLLGQKVRDVLYFFLYYTATQYLFSVAMMAYLGYFNLLNFSCGIVPITKVTAEDVKNDVEGFPAKDMYHSEAKSVSIV